MYSAERYQDVILSIEEGIIAGEGFEGQFIYLGNANLAIEQFDEAINAFNQVATSSRFYPDALWYTALTHLAREDSQEARAVLFELQTMNSLYNSSASDLIDELE